MRYINSRLGNTIRWLIVSSNFELNEMLLEPSPAYLTSNAVSNMRYYLSLTMKQTVDEYTRRDF